MIAGAVVAEKLFSIPGIGSLIVDRITYKDEPVIIAGTILIAVVFTGYVDCRSNICIYRPKNQS